MRSYAYLFLVLLAADFSDEYQRQARRRRRDQRRSGYSWQSFQPWFPKRMPPRWRIGSETTVTPLQKPRARKDLNPMMDKLMKASEVADPLVPNMNISQMGFEVDLMWMSGLSSVKRVNDILFYDQFTNDSKAVEFTVKVQNTRTYLKYKLGTFSYFYTYTSNGSVYLDNVQVMIRFSYKLSTNETDFDTFKIIERSKIRMDFSEPGSELFVSIVETFFLSDIDEKILPMVKRMIQYELGYVDLRAVLERLSPGKN